MSKPKKKKNSYCPQNTIEHPKYSFFDNLVRNQPDLVALKNRVQASRHAYTENATGSMRDKHSAVKLYEDIASGKHPTCGPEDLEYLADLFTKKFAVKHKFRALGVELSPGDHPMLDGNICVDLTDGNGISAAVATAKSRPGFPIVSHNVWGQLNNEQRRELAQVDNIHQYAVEPRSRIFDANPTGFYPHCEDDSGIGITYSESAGVNRIYHFLKCSFELEVVEIIQPSVIVEIGEELAEEYGIGIGRFKVNSSGITAVGNLLPGDRGQSDATVRKALEVFKQRDNIGTHATEVDLVGPTSPKIDGIFLKMVASKGTAEFRFRNGRRWISGDGACKFNMTAAFELVHFDGKQGVLYCLYVEKFRGNFISMRKEVQDYMRSRFTMTVRFKPGVGRTGGEFSVSTVSSAEGLPSDGLVVHTGNKHFFYKKNNTVDITSFLADRLEERYGIKVFRKVEMSPGLIYEYKTCKQALAGAGIEPLLNEDGEMTARPPLTKVLPNKMKNVLEAIKSPTLDDLKRAHDKNHPGQVCEVCASI